MNPNSETNRFSANENLISIDFPFIRIRQAPPRIGWRGRPARERGLNENSIIVPRSRPRVQGPHFPAFAQEAMNHEGWNS